MNFTQANKIAERRENQGFVPTVVKVGKTFRVSVKCDHCAVVAINGTATHETGCPAARFWMECGECDGGEWVSSQRVSRKAPLLCDACLTAEDPDGTYEVP